MSDRTFIIGAITASIVLFSGLIILGVYATISEQRDCEAKGGHMLSKSDSGFAINPSNGQLSPTFSTTRFCISADGRILE